MQMKEGLVEEMNRCGKAFARHSNGQSNEAILRIATFSDFDYHINMKRLIMIFNLLFCANLHAQPFDSLTSQIANGDYGNLKAVVISHQGQIIYEEYFRGTRANDLHAVNSVTKSVGSALIGIANRQGKIELDDDMTKFFGALYPMSTGAFSNKQAITVEDILQQRSGIRWDEWTLPYTNASNPMAQAMSSADWYRYVLTTPIDAQPGEKFIYNTAGSTLMSRMIRSTTGMSPRSFAMTRLFGPLGISNIHWEGWSPQGMGNGMTEFPNPDGDEPLGFMLWMRPLDMLKFGELYLNDGVHEGQRIIEKEWIEASWQAYSNHENTELFTRPGSGYGYQWWTTFMTDTRDRSFPAYYAEGWAHQFILIIPQLDLVFVSVADDYEYTGPGIGTILRTTVLPGLSPALDKRFNGTWYDLETSGQGIALEVVEDRNLLIGSWFTYDDNGGKRWFVLNGDINGTTAEVSIIQTSGGVFLQPDPVEESEWGTGRFTTVDCNHVNFEIMSEEVNTTVELTRLTGTCE